MRILLTTANQSIVGGIEKYVQQIIPALLDREHEIALLYEHRSADGSETVDPPGARLPIWYWQDVSPSSPVWRQLIDWNPDVVYSQGLGSLGVENVLLDRYPTIWYAHVYNGTCITGRKCHAFPKLTACTREFGPACLALYYPRRCGGLNPLRAAHMYRMQAERNHRLADYKQILVASRHMYAEYERHGVSPEKLGLLPLPVPDLVPEPNQPTSRQPNGSILFVGRLTDLKGVDYLIRAVPIAAKNLGRPLTLKIGGDGPGRESLARLAGQSGVKVEFTGWLNVEQKKHALQNADLLAVPSLWPEPFGLIGIEAGCYGLPAVGYAVGGITDWLIAGETGEIAPGNSPTVEGLADAITRALGDPTHYARLCRKAWELSRQFTLEKHVTKLDAILYSVCQSDPIHLGASLPSQERTTA